MATKRNLSDITILITVLFQVTSIGCTTVATASTSIPEIGCDDNTGALDADSGTARYDAGKIIHDSNSDSKEKTISVIIDPSIEKYATANRYRLTMIDDGLTVTWRWEPNEGTSQIVQEEALAALISCKIDPKAGEFAWSSSQAAATADIRTNAGEANFARFKPRVVIVHKPKDLGKIINLVGGRLDSSKDNGTFDAYRVIVNPDVVELSRASFYLREFRRYAGNSMVSAHFSSVDMFRTFLVMLMLRTKYQDLFSSVELSQLPHEM